VVPDEPTPPPPTEPEIPPPIIVVTPEDPPDTVRDERDGQLYDTVQIGDQIWMKQNLNWGGPDGDIGIFFDKDTDEVWPGYGRMYMRKHLTSIVIPGWRIPTVADWVKLRDFTNPNHGPKLRSVDYWTNFSPGLDEYGFRALPTGIYHGGLHVWQLRGTSCFWWTQESILGNIRACIFNSDYLTVATQQVNPDQDYQSVRLIKE